MAAVTKSDITSGVLPKKEQEIFRSVVSNYESKQHRKGLKNADLILKKYPSHGETLAMKGLICNSLGKKEEAYELVKQGLKNGVRSHICWHVFGLLHKSDKNLKEASKCYLNALRIDPSNQNILRDLSSLQLQVRDLPGFMTTRRKILDAKPTIGTSWVAYAVGNFLVEEYTIAYDVVAKYMEGTTQDSNFKNWDEKHAESELFLFQNRCLERQGKYDDAIVHLRKNESKLVDGLSFRVKVAELMVLTGRFEEAKFCWYLLVKEQGENFRFHAGLQAALLELAPAVSQHMFTLIQMELPSTVMSLTDAQCKMLVEFYEKHKAQFKARAYDKVMLTLLCGEAFDVLLESFIRSNLHDEVPALVHDVCWLVRGVDPLQSAMSAACGTEPAVSYKCFKDPVDFRAHPVTVKARGIIDRLIANLETNQSFDGTGGAGAGAGAGTEAGAGSSSSGEPPGVLLWALLFRAHIEEHCGETEAAMATIERCIEHTPTALDMFSKKAHLLKRGGSYQQAAMVMDYGRSLDLQDRYLNNKTTKFMMRADLIQQGMDTIALFTKHEGDPQQTLYELQANWYELELAEAYARGKQWGLALKKFHAIQNHFQLYFDDMADFHGYAVRKQTMRVYTDILAMQDRLVSHKFFQRACRGIVAIYLHLVDYPEDIDGLGHLNAADRKKERARVKKQREKERKDEEAKKKAALEDAKWSGEKLPGADKEKDEDPLGDAYLGPKAPATFLSEAALWCAHISPQTKASEPETLALVAEVMLRRGKYLQAVRSLRCGLEATPHHPALSVMLVKVAAKVGGGASNAGAAVGPEARLVVQSVVKEELEAMVGRGMDLQGFSGRYVALARGGSSLPHRTAAARIAALCDKAQGKATAVQVLTEDGAFNGRGVTVDALLDVLHAISKDLKLEPAAADELCAQVRARGALLFPLAVAFGAPQAVAEVVNSSSREEGAQDA